MPDAGDIIYPDDINAGLDLILARLDDIETLNPACRVRNYSAQDLPEATDVTIDLEVNPYNQGGLHPGSGFVPDLTIPKAGIYLVTCQSYWDVETAGIRHTAVRRNSSVDLFTLQGEGVGGDTTPLNGAGEAFFSVGETLQLVCRKESGTDGPQLLRCWMTVRYARGLP